MSDTNANRLRNLAPRALAALALILSTPALARAQDAGVDEAGRPILTIPLARPPHPYGNLSPAAAEALLKAAPSFPSDAVASQTAAVGQTAAPIPPASPGPAPVVTDKLDFPMRGVGDKEVSFGISAPFSGPQREIGRQLRQGIETAFDLANDSGGVAGRHLKLLYADDGYEPSRALDNMRSLYERDQVFGIIGNVGTATAEAVLPYALDHRLMFYGAFTGASVLRAEPPDRFVFNFRPSYAEETAATVRYLTAVRGFKPREIAVLSQDDAYGASGVSGVDRALRASVGGGYVEPGLRMTYKRNTIDMTSALALLRQRRPAPIKAVIMVATYRAAAKFIELTRPTVPGLVYTNVSFVGGSELADELRLLGPAFADGVVVTEVVPPVEGHSKAVMDFQASLERYFPGERPSHVSFEGYLDGQLLIEAMRRVGRNLTTETLATAFESIHDLDLGIGEPIGFTTSDHQAAHKVWGTQMDKTGHFSVIDLQ